MNAKEISLPLETLEELLDYDPITGFFIWKKANSVRVKVGAIAGSFTLRGYISININRHTYYAHRLAWFYFYGVWPTYDIDHINGVPTENWIGNLRDTTKSNNLKNRKGKSKLYPKGVTKVGAFYRATICDENRVIQLGKFSKVEEAAAAYEVASRHYHGEFSIFNRP